MPRETQPERKIRKALENSEPVEELVAECLELEAEVCEELLAKLSELQPTLGTEVRDRLANLGELGLTGNMPEQIPEQLGDFRLLERIGAGGMGVVYLAEQVSLGRKVALKLIRPGQLYFPGTRERFQREVRTIAQLRHKNIVPIHAVGEEQGIPYYAMQWIEGASLGDILGRLAGRVPEQLRRKDLEEALSLGASVSTRVDPDALEHALPGRTWPDLCLTIMAQISEALHYAHERGVLHRDIKPSNIMLSTAGEVQLLDFGLASSEGANQLTRSGALVGTLPYMSPEQLSGSSASLDRRSDVYALGVALYELLALRSPFSEESAERTRGRILAGSAPALRSLNRAVSWDVETVCMRALEREPAERYASAAEFAADLVRARDRLPIAARRPPLWRRALRWGRIHPGQAVALVGLFIIAVAAIAIGAYEQQRRRKTEQLADVQTYRYLVQQADTFWPVDPKRMSDMRTWLEEARKLLARRELHTQSLAELRQRANPQSRQEVLEDQTPVIEDLVGLAREVEGLIHYLLERGELDQQQLERPLAPGEPGAFVRAGLTASEPERRERTLAALRQRIDLTLACAQGTPQLSADVSQLVMFLERCRAAQALLAQRRSWHFSDEIDRWRHGLLSELVVGTDQLEDRSSDVREQLDLARKLEAAPEEPWNQARAAILRDPIYNGLDLPPQVDLEPLGRNPQSGLWEFLLVATGSEPQLAPTSEDPGRRQLQPDFGIVLVLLPGGAFTMGNPEDAGNPKSLLRPHRVELDPFFIAKYELTYAQARALGFELDAIIGPQYNLHPIGRAWAECRGRLQTKGLDLPTEAQWEYAARGGTTTIFFVGDNASSLNGYGNFRDQSYATYRQTRTGRVEDPTYYFEFDDGFDVSAPVGSFLPNPFGLYDILGNVKEWCLDWYVTRGYHTIPARPVDGLRETKLKGAQRVSRGDSFQTHYSNRYKSHRREGSSPSSSLGVRPVRPIR